MRENPGPLQVGVFSYLGHAWAVGRLRPVNPSAEGIPITVGVHLLISGTYHEWLPSTKHGLPAVRDKINRLACLASEAVVSKLVAERFLTSFSLWRRSHGAALHQVSRKAAFAFPGLVIGE